MPQAAELAAKAELNGHVRVIVMFATPVAASEVRPDPASLASVKARVAATQDAIIATHFSSATPPASGPGFDRALTRFPITPGFALNVSLAELEALAADGRVTRINEDRAVPPALNESVPLIGMTTAYSLGATGAGQAVAVLDTGVKANHEFLAGKVIAEACFSNGGGGAGRVSLCPGGGNTQTGAGAADADTAQCVDGATQLCDHGTHVAGIAAGLNTNPQGGEPVNGVAKSGSIFALQVFTRFNNAGDCAPSAAPCVLTWNSDQVSALDHIFSNLTLAGGVKVAAANMSLGGGTFANTCDGQSQKPAIDNLRAAGVLTAIASGNDGFTNATGSPGCISTAVTVGSTTDSDTISSFSNMSPVVDLLAPGGGSPPGTNILSSIPVVPASNTSAYANFQGTSMATPHVAGAIAAIRSACPAATASQIETALKDTGTPVTDTRIGGSQTKPRIRVDLAVQSLGCAAAPPANDNFAGALVLYSGLPQSANNALATKEAGEPNHAGNAGGKSVWWYFTALASGQVTVTTSNSTFDTLLGVYTGNSVGALTPVASNDNVGGGFVTSQVSFAATAGTVYRIAVDGANGASGTISITLSAPFPPTTLACSTASNLGDLNGDARKDLVFRRNDGLMSVYFMNGSQVQSGQIIGLIGAEFTLVGVGDFNGDGKADFLFRRADGTLSIFLMNGAAVIDAQIIGNVGNEWNVVGVGDFNGDGRADILTRRTDGLLGLYLINGFQVLAGQILGSLGLEFTVAQVADFNGDGRADFLTRRADGAVAVYLMNGFQILSATLLGSIGSEWRLISANDFNGDGRADFLTRRADGTLALYLLNGTQILGAQVIGNIGTEWSFVGSGDLNGDARADMVFRRPDGNVSSYLMNGFQLLSGAVAGNIGTEWTACYGQGGGGVARVTTAN